ncbi:hypothetical protein AURDEDRAFT_155228 [Auricularia subglabra TFB-10046 SS5]|nr:hypothetical protein AURDEDRAFT_155228 [Auricularia subglabra TFB-10046 SS5]
MGHAAIPHTQIIARGPTAAHNLPDASHYKNDEGYSQYRDEDPHDRVVMIAQLEDDTAIAAMMYKQVGVRTLFVTVARSTAFLNDTAAGSLPCDAVVSRRATTSSKPAPSLQARAADSVLSSAHARAGVRDFYCNATLAPSVPHFPRTTIQTKIHCGDGDG